MDLMMRHSEWPDYGDLNARVDTSGSSIVLMRIAAASMSMDVSRLLESFDAIEHMRRNNIRYFNEATQRVSEQLKKHIRMNDPGIYEYAVQMILCVRSRFIKYIHRLTCVISALNGIAARCVGELMTSESVMQSHWIGIYKSIKALMNEYVSLSRESERAYTTNTKIIIPMVHMQKYSDIIALTLDLTHIKRTLEDEIEDVEEIHIQYITRINVAMIIDAGDDAYSWDPDYQLPHPTEDK